MFAYYQLLNFLSYLFFVTNFCVKGVISNYGAKLQWSMNAEGFHREIKYNLEVLANGTWTDCQIMTKQVIPRSLYVNKDQLEDLRRLKKVTAIVNDFIDTEMPEDVSTPHDVYLWSTFNETDNILTSDIYLPIHARYHTPQPGGGFQSAILTPPEIYIKCTQISNNYSATTKLPCSPDSGHLCEYYQLSYEIEKSLLEILVPVGNSDHYNTVVLITYFVTIAGTFYIFTVILLSLPKSKKD